MKVKSYLFSTAHNFIIDMFRKNKRTSYEEVLPEQGYQPQSHNDELKEMLDKCLVQLSDSYLPYNIKPVCEQKLAWTITTSSR